jgi:hypothetical protein
MENGPKPTIDNAPDEEIVDDPSTETAPNASPELQLLPGGLENGEEAVDTRVPSRIAYGMNRVADFLQDRVEGLNERAADRDKRAIARSERKAYRSDARREMLKSAKASIFKIGRGALRVAKVTGHIAAETAKVTVGIGVMGAEAGALGIKKGAEFTASAASSAKEAAVSAGASVAEKARDTGETISIAALLAGDKVRGEAARARKEIRVRRYEAQKTASEALKRANTKRRAIGAGALSFFDRARAAGEAAKNTWESHGTQNKL